MRFNPTSRSTIKAGDTLIALGEISKLKVLENMSRDKAIAPRNTTEIELRGDMVSYGNF